MKIKHFFILFFILGIVIFTAGCVGEDGRNGRDGKDGRNGINGINGLNGLGTFDINSTFTTEPGTNANVVNTGNSSVAHFDFYIPRGNQGAQGIQGIQGVNGTPGEKGETGAQGIQGIQGEPGAQGIQGIQGLKGDKGDKGDQGIQGIQGEQGIPGEDGEDGYTPIFGVDYFNGSQGIQGEKGDKGDPGTTDYNLLDNLPDLGIYWTGTNYNSSYLTSTFNATYDAKPSSTYNETYDAKPSSTYNETYDLKPTLSQVYPVGSVYISVSSTNPGTLFGGTWSAFGAGRVLVGLDSGDTSFDTVEETGGAKTVASAGTVGSISATGSSSVKGGTSSSVNAAAQTHTHSAPSFTGTATSVVQPYIVVYMWKRTA